MTRFNFGVIKATFTHHLNESEDISIKNMFSTFMNMITESKLLQTEFQIYKNLEGKYLPNENLAIKYIDENIDLITSNFSKEDIINENAKLFPLIEGLEIKVSGKKKELYNHIHTIIYESLKGNKLTNVDKLHDSFTFVLEYITNNKPILTESDDFSAYQSVPKDFLVKKAIEKFNDKYSVMNESQRNLFGALISENNDVKSTFFTTIKDDTITSLKSLLGESDVVDSKINESISKIESMKYNEESYAKDIFSLVDLKENLN